MPKKIVFTPQPMREANASLTKNIDEAFRVLNALNDTIDQLKGALNDLLTKNGGVTSGVGTDSYLPIWADGANGILGNSSCYEDDDKLRVEKAIEAKYGVMANTENDLTKTTNVPTWIKITINYDELLVADTETSVVLSEIPSHTILHAVKIKHTEAFAGGSVSSVVISIGHVLDNEMVAPEFDISTPVDDDNYQLVEYTDRVL